MKLPRPLARLLGLRPEAPAPAPDSTLDDWWGGSWMWEPGDLDEIEESDQ
ncbi:hypothetical protein [Streptomyces albipurpureus]|uniref:Uncharacterized protein n=1 Tax=Streptomyces albipurpureus TaxID=2897419 RepID=A0ABT0USB0_9ACTN|nr:hypothetical protein [Streptomyces sp. CWNU-1]MCM2391334.1 hypothetical protein [Streptomyces sp. CWNU-1]